MSKKTLYWLQGGACGGDSWSWASVESPNVVELLSLLDFELLWHPSLCAGQGREHQALIKALIAGEQPLDVLCLEGSVVRGPGGTGMYDSFEGRPKKDLVAGLARQAQHVLAVGTCASFGGMGAGSEIEATGLQFTRGRIGGFLGPDFRGRAGTPVINLAGCPCHGEVVSGVLTGLAVGVVPPLGQYNTPAEWYGSLVHQGCTRDEHHEFRIEERDFGEKGCLFFYKGCRGPLAHGPCNKLPWNRWSSKTRVGVPCVGCTEPDFPRAHPFFETRSIADVPLELPEGVD